MQGSLALASGEGTLAVVEGCGEDALWQARASSSFGDTVGSNETVGPDGACTAVVASKVGNTWTMTVTNSVNTRYRLTMRIIFERGVTNLALTSWREE